MNKKDDNFKPPIGNIYFNESFKRYIKKIAIFKILQLIENFY